ncbi:unnamed protein product [Effrenium voratum]|nr:unnamed protein product [Effrenium voratum]
MRGRLAHAATGFYVNCDAYSTAADAPKRGIQLFLEDEGLKTRLRVMRQLDNTPDAILDEQPNQTLKMVDIDHAAKYCAEDPQCTGLCFSSEEGWTHYYHTELRNGYKKDASGTKGWECLSLKGFGPPGTGLREEMRPCFKALEEVSQGSWQPTKVPKDWLELPDGSWMQLRIYPDGSTPPLPNMLGPSAFQERRISCLLWPCVGNGRRARPKPAAEFL